MVRSSGLTKIVGRLDLCLLTQSCFRANIMSVIPMDLVGIRRRRWRAHFDPW